MRGLRSILLPLAAAALLAAVTATVAGPLDKAGTMWAPYLEWSLDNPSHSGNPYDVVATATFVHGASGRTHRTEMFYAGGTTWKFRFTGTREGTWTFTTSSADPELGGHSGTVTIGPNPDPKIKGFVTAAGNRWGRMDSDEVFVPQYAMYADPRFFHDKPAMIDADIQTFMVGHGFSGFHVMGSCHWFDINKEKSTDITNTDPDPRTFEAMELIITKTHAAGGVVHLWMWGDEERRWTPKRWGLNGAEDRRLQRYLAARLGPLPGWTMGYGFDLQEWVTEAEIASWVDYMHDHLGWPHILGGRNRFTAALDYSGYEQHKPPYDTYVWTIEDHPNRPSMSEDRFRVRGGGGKDYSLDETRRGLWHSTMAGGVSNIWGYLLEPYACANVGECVSGPYPNKDEIKTHFRFFQSRFVRDLVRDNAVTDGKALKHPGLEHYLVYKEDATTVQLNLAGMNGPQTAVAVDTRRPYSEIEIGQLAPENQTWTAPRASDWAIAIGDFGNVSPAPVGDPPTPPRGLRIK